MPPRKKKTTTRRKAPAKPGSKKKKRKRSSASLLKRVRRAMPSWSSWVGVALVVVAAWLLLRNCLNSSQNTDIPPGFAVHGIDISHHQGRIDWERLRNQAQIDGQPVAFVFIKATEGASTVDKQFSRNFSEAERYGIRRGAYHFFRPSVSARQQADNFIRNVKLKAGDLPPVLDVEVRPAGVSDEAFRQGILEWLARVEQHYGIRPILYTYHSFRQQYMNDPVFSLYPYWIAHYHVDSLRYRGAWTLWQHSDRGRLPGIKGDVDLNVFNGEYEDLLKLTVK